MVDVSDGDRLTSLGRQGLPRTSLAEDVDVMRRPVVGPVAMAMVLLSCQSQDDYHPDAVAVKRGGDDAIDGGRFEHLDTAIPGWLRAYDVPSAAVAVVENGEIVWSGVYGQRSPTMPASEQTLYLTASIAKPVTGEVVLRLASRGDIALDEPMAPHWLDPDVADDPRALRLTPRHVLTHQTGFKNWRYMTAGILRFEWAPGDAVGYSGEGFQYLVRFVERKLNRPFNDIAQELLFVPAGMHSSAMVRQDWYEGRLAWALSPDGEWREPRSSNKALGAGGMRTTSQDYARFIISILNHCCPN